jgi:hypothetical protein
VAIVATIVLSAAAWSTELFSIDLENSGLMWLVIACLPVLTIAFWTAVFLTFKLRSPDWPKATPNG